jgi:Ni,Fe-hydrogenase III large subunit
VAIYAVVRCKVLVEGSLHSQLPSQMLMGFGLLSVVLAAFFLWRQRDIKRLFAYSSIEHMGIIAFAFGMGGPVANFAALLHMTVHSLTKSAIFFAAGHAAQKAGSQLMQNIRGLITLSPTVGWGLMMGSLAILGMPPFGVFASEFLILTTAMREQPWATPILLAALGIAFAAIFGRVQPMVFGETTAKRLPHPPALLPVFAHLAIVLALGIFIPPYLADWYRAAALARSAAYAGAPGLRGLTVTPAQWRQLAQDLAGAGARLLTLWASPEEPPALTMRAAFLTEDGALVMSLPLAHAHAAYPGMEDLFSAAARMQRAVADLTGVRSDSSHPDSRPWLRHAAWPRSYLPLVDAPLSSPGAAAEPDSYEFVRVEGDGVHEIAVGPVHAGTIEPGHFRFSVVGEKVLRLEERLGYVHKGIEQRFTQLPILEAHRLAARVSGDSAVAFSWAYCQALEGLTDTQIPARAAWLRALYLEIERIANHLGDLGALGNDAGFAFGLSQFARLKEQLLRASDAALGARYLLDAVVPGGTRWDLRASGLPILRDCLRAIEREALRLRTIYDEHEGVRDRFNGAGTVSAQLAARLGLTGLAGRASGQAYDLRIDLPCEPYADLAPVKIGRSEGDVAARVAVRFEELQESLRLADRVLDALPAGSHVTPVPVPAARAIGAGLIEGWRGPVFVALEAGDAGSIRRCHPHDPSWQNWPVLEHAIIGNIVPDFPLINKSFNLSYSGHDL